MKNSKSIFHNLFVLELANNHLGSLVRGKKIISEYGQVVRFNKIKAAIKLQFRDVDNFIHDSYKDMDERYIKKTLSTKLDKKGYKTLVDHIKKNGCLPMATPFDEKSVDLCVDFKFPIIKIASSDCNDWPLIEKIASTKKPVIVSTGGVSEKDLDDVVLFFKNRKIDLAINHCVSLYPSEDSELMLNQIDYLKNRYPENIIGFSSHEYNDWSSSMHISYAKGARTWERHIDIEFENVKVSKYNSLPHQVDQWFKSFHKAVEMCGPNSDERRIITKNETEYLDKLVRGVYAKKDLKQGLEINSSNLNKNFFLAIPLQKGQLSCRELLNGEILINGLKKGEPLKIEDIEGPYSKNKSLKQKITNRGIKI
tara:strand:+ start:832 stop:1932 length:1101 start_codon:yes stop_codon:yes gene_type:complete